MANDTVISVRGWAGCDPTVYRNEHPDSGADLKISAAVFTLGVTPRVFNKHSRAYEDGTTTWYSVRCFGALAVNVGMSVHRGAPLLVRGRLAARSFTDKRGVERTIQQIVADSVAIDLNFMVATYSKAFPGARENKLDMAGKIMASDACDVQVMAGANSAVGADGVPSSSDGAQSSASDDQHQQSSGSAAFDKEFAELMSEEEGVGVLAKVG
ncbi:MAG: single-stranded DNA-binding protein [Arcanobacterium sp.]|nr:single-stranded DNA-binding protein [Arcanobacterium sp.]MDY5588927.1 single-stranded DNA-binding protein [Arcanobacterium sp.]